MLLPLLLAAWTGCGLTFNVPRGWHAAVVDDTPTQCEIGLEPPGWERMRKKSRWPEEELAISVRRYRMTFEQALDDIGFERDDQGRWGMPSFRGMFEPARPVRYGAFRGLRNEPWGRQYAKEGADLGDYPRVQGSSEVFIALHDARETVVSIIYGRGSPDTPFDRDAAANVVIASLRAATPPTARTR